jgi:hypothetical protein
MSHRSGWQPRWGGRSNFRIVRTSPVWTAVPGSNSVVGGFTLTENTRATLYQKLHAIIVAMMRIPTSADWIWPVQRPARGAVPEFTPAYWEGWTRSAPSMLRL